uniref:Uncharacterized protein n=1 Tax=Tanacetum cinerariifolium TaxID=118510 RepID=A0A699JBK1_TANCI|nr:hypothetical protein [Tanacetum cinerariifolium]
MQTTCHMEEPLHLVFETGVEDQPIVQTSQHPEWFSQPRKPLTPDRVWNKTLPAAQGSAQSWISELAKQTDVSSSFNELLDTPIDFSNFIMNRLDVNTLTPELLAVPTYELMRGSCQQYPHNLLQPLSLIPDNRGRRVIPFEHFINNDLEYLRGGALSQKYTTSVTETKVTDYGHIKWIEELTMATTIEQQVAPDEALVPSAQRLRIGRSNFRLPSDIQSKESTLQVVYDVLRRSPFFKAFLVTTDVPEIYMQEFWAMAYVHQHSIRFKMDTRKNIIDLEAFRVMLHQS